MLLFALSGLAQSAEPGVRVPILLYHRFGPVVADAMTVTTATFETQLRALRDGGYSVVPLRELLRGLEEGGVQLPARAVVIVADDGHRSVYSDMFPLIKKYRLPVTLFIYPSAISNASYALTWAQLVEMKTSGLVDVQSHSYWHPNFSVERKRLSPDAYDRLVRDQLLWSKRTIEKHLGGPVDLLAWPFGIYDAQLMSAARSAGYVAGFSIERRPVTAAENIMAVPRYIVTDADRGRVFEGLLAGPVETRPASGY